MLEQPASSLMYRHPRWRSMADKVLEFFSIRTILQIVYDI